jgi:hypothetical protein
MIELVTDLKIIGNVQRTKGLGLGTKHQHIFDFVCHDKNGKLKWTDKIWNKVPLEGIDEMLNKFYAGSSYTAAHYVGLAGTSPTFADADTMSSHDGWEEVEDYDNIATRASLTMGTAADQSIDNSDNLAVFVINDDSIVIGGAFITTGSAIGGTSGILLGGGAFSAGDKTLDNDDVLSITVTATGASA